MNKQDYDKAVKHLTEDRKKVSQGKRKDYTRGDEDVLANFKNQGEYFGIDPKLSLAVHMEKQFSAVCNYIKTNGKSESEPIIKRIGDTINYLELLWGLICEEKKKENGTATDSNVGQTELIPRDVIVTDNLHGHQFQEGEEITLLKMFNYNENSFYDAENANGQRWSVTKEEFKEIANVQ